MRYLITYFVPVRTSWLDWHDRMETEHVKTKKDLDLLVACILEDKSIDRAFYEDMTNHKITHIKAQGKPFSL